MTRSACAECSADESLDWDEEMGGPREPTFGSATRSDFNFGLQLGAYIDCDMGMDWARAACSWRLPTVA